MCFLLEWHVCGAGPHGSPHATGGLRIRFGSGQHPRPDPDRHVLQLLALRHGRPDRRDAVQQTQARVSGHGGDLPLQRPAVFRARNGNGQFGVLGGHTGPGGLVRGVQGGQFLPAATATVAQ